MDARSGGLRAAGRVDSHINCSHMTASQRAMALGVVGLAVFGA
jgi:hypothetical protein